MLWENQGSHCQMGASVGHEQRDTGLAERTVSERVEAQGGSTPGTVRIPDGVISEMVSKSPLPYMPCAKR